MAQQNVMQCRTCGSMIPKGSRPCPSCRTPNPQEWRLPAWETLVLLLLLVTAGISTL